MNVQASPPEGGVRRFIWNRPRTAFFLPFLVPLALIEMYRGKGLTLVFLATSFTIAQGFSVFVRHVKGETEDVLAGGKATFAWDLQNNLRLATMNIIGGAGMWVVALVGIAT